MGKVRGLGAVTYRIVVRELSTSAATSLSLPQSQSTVAHLLRQREAQNKRCLLSGGSLMSNFSSSSRAAAAREKVSAKLLTLP